MSDDLYEFERKRLENIKRNTAFLSSLGLDKLQKAAEIHSTAKIKKDKLDKRSRESKYLKRELPTRSSKRLRGEKVPINVNHEISESEEESEAQVRYDLMPEVTIFCNYRSTLLFILTELTLF